MLEGAGNCLGHAAQQAVVCVARKPLVSAKIVLAARAFKGGGVGAYAVQQGCGQSRAGAHAHGLEVTGHHGAGCAHAGANVTKGRKACKGAGRDVGQGAGQGVVVYDAVKVQTLKCLAVVRL